MVMRRKTFEAVGPFDETMGLGEDLDWFFRLHESGIEIEILKEELLTRRIHNGSLTQDADAARVGLFDAFRKKAERCRAGGRRSSP
jgi:GT2 family glycosyltransferase